MAKNIMKIAGTAMWAKVTEPDTKFNPDGDIPSTYKCLKLTQLRCVRN